MKTLDQTSSLFWLLVSLSVLVESIRLGIGTPRNPGMGFMTFGASGILGILSLVLFLKASLKKREVKTPPLFAGMFWKRILFVLIVLTLYSRMMPVLGYLISTFLLMIALFWVLERKRVIWVLVSSILATLITYFVFSKWLNCQFPDGLFGL
ncbi:MAG: tripartite tricarboxylate transporter TctB family protein [Thermodesulfobacteriota bacterium]|nr:tripartite tricarboxylate transporter TctB family protein [Thermodesulfobacteriota bacterium]